jgi:hypothetical protein
MYCLSRKLGAKLIRLAKNAISAAHQPETDEGVLTNQRDIILFGSILSTNSGKLAKGLYASEAR